MCLDWWLAMCCAWIVCCRGASCCPIVGVSHSFRLRFYGSYAPPLHSPAPRLGPWVTTVLIMNPVDVRNLDMRELQIYPDFRQLVVQDLASRVQSLGHQQPAYAESAFPNGTFLVTQAVKWTDRTGFRHSWEYVLRHRAPSREYRPAKWELFGSTPLTCCCARTLTTLAVPQGHNHCSMPRWKRPGLSRTWAMSR
ncbi:hypothetical protein C8R43DRAFT_1043596 [Mycena crocata]|nr:hypothetical protein C8R43DRAFT_1043596 [Mycena crocata]